MSRKVSIRVLAEELGLSKYAVSRALSGKSGVSEATRQRVMELAKTLGYQHRQQAPALQTGEREQASSAPYILVCMSHAHSANAVYWQRVLNGLLRSCDELGYPTIIVSPEPEPARADQSPQQAIAPHLDWSRCGGIVVMGNLPEAVLSLIARAERPYVLVDHTDDLTSCDKVNNDNIEAGEAITRHLLSLKCRHIAMITDEAWSPSFEDRLTGARITISRQPEGAVKLTEWRIRYGAPWEQSLYERMLELGPASRPDAWIGANDDIAIRWMRKLQSEGHAIPAFTRIAGIDNVEAATLVTPSLTTVNLCKEELGQRAVEALIRRMERPGAPTETIHLSTRLIVRDSA